MKRTTLICLAFAVSSAAMAEQLYTIQESTDTLFTINSNNGVLTRIGPLGVPTSFGDLAYNPNTGKMYLVNGWGNGSANPSSLYTVNLTTGAATLVGSTGQKDVFGLTFDPVTGKMFGSKSTISQGFMSINPATGAGTMIGNPGINLDGLTYVGSTGDVLGLLAGPGSLHKIDRATGAQTQVSAGGGFVDNCGIAWVAANNSVYSIDWSGNFFRFDVAAGYARTTIVTGLGSYDGLASTNIIPEPATLIALGVGVAALARRRRK